MHIFSYEQFSDAYVEVVYSPGMESMRREEKSARSAWRSELPVKEGECVDPNVSSSPTVVVLAVVDRL